MFGECHTPYMLKTSFVDFEKMCRHIVTTALQKTKFSVPTQLSILYQWQSKVDTTMTSLSIVYIYIIKLVLILNIIEILVNQSLKYGSGLKHIIYLENIWCLISSPGPKVHVNYCHHLASVVCRLSSVNFSHFKLLLRNHLADWNRT